MSAQTLPGELPEGWFVSGPERSASLLAELAREVSLGHVLHGARISVVAHREGTDDVLCRHLDDPSRFTVVHLSWLRAEEIDMRHPTFHSCGCGGPGYRPREPAKLAAFFNERILACHRIRRRRRNLA